MPQSPRDLIVRAGDEVRGTQSFVQVMASVWMRPSLVGMEIAWRWAAGLVVFAALAAENKEAFVHRSDPEFWSGVGTALMHGAFTFRPTGSGVFVTVSVIVLWAVVSGLARSAILRRLDPTLHPRRGTVVALSVLRVLAHGVLIAAWVWALESIWFRMVANADPDYVLGFAGAVVWTLLLFMFWSVVSWIFPLATMLAMARDMGVGASLRVAWGSVALRSKLIEINLVMGIVKIALVVLAMVFSATPLPFQAFTTQGFLWVWWIVVALLYLLASDFFHVVRQAAALALYRAYDSR